MSNYTWRDKTDPNSFGAKWEEGFRHYRSEYERLSNLLIDSHTAIPEIDWRERDAMRYAMNEAAARVVGFSYYLIP